MVVTGYVAASVAKTVVVFVSVKCVIFSVYVMLTGGSVPVAVFIGRPNVFVVGMLVSVVPCTNVTFTVVVSIDMLASVLIAAIVIARYCVPVLVFVLRPFGFVFVSMIVVPSASVTDTVVVLVSVRIKLLGYVVSALSSVPVVGFVVGPNVLVGVIVVVIPFTNVADAVVVFIRVLFLILRIGVASADGLEIVVGSVVSVLIIVLVLTENVITCFDVAVTVVVLVLVGAGNGSTALVALKILVYVSVNRTFYYGKADITLKISVVVDVNRAGLRGVKQSTRPESKAANDYKQ